MVVLTGATGFVGGHLLRHLSEDDTVEKIHCLAVRNSANREVLSTLRKVTIHYGDLVLPRLGLSDQEAASIFEEADAIIHNGCDVSHMKAYRSLKQANLEATKELVKLSLPRRIPFHYVSTAGVALFSGKNSFDETSAAPYPPPIDGSDGYTASKWASERHLEKVNAHFQLPVFIYRPSSISRPGAPKLDLMQNLLHYSRQLRAVPTSPNLSGMVDIVSVDTVAAGIVRRVALRHHAPADQQPHTVGVVRYIHQSGDLEIPLTRFKEFLEKETVTAAGVHVPFAVFPALTWAVRAEDAGLNPLVAAFFKNVDHLGLVTFPRLLKGNDDDDANDDDDGREED